VAAVASRSPEPRIRVLVYGEDASGALERVRAQQIEYVELIDAESGLIATTSLERLARDAGVRYLQVDSPVESTETPAPAAAPSSAALATLYPLIDGAPVAWNQGLSGAGIGIAVIDSGVSPNPDFGSRLAQVPLAGQSDLSPSPTWSPPAATSSPPSRPAPRST
jgi:hypothetical protein